MDKKSLLTSSETTQTAAMQGFFRPATLGSQPKLFKVLPHQSRSDQMVAIIVKTSVNKVATSSSHTFVVFPPCVTAPSSLPFTGTKCKRR